MNPNCGSILELSKKKGVVYSNNKFERSRDRNGNTIKFKTIDKGVVACTTVLTW